MPTAKSINGAYVPSAIASTRTRKVALFEGKDEFGRLQPLLGTAEPATDYKGNPINWPSTPAYQCRVWSAKWRVPLPGTLLQPRIRLWDLQRTWEVWNATGDAHPVHLHLVHFDY